MKEFTSIITPQCEITIPDEVRHALGVELGDMVRFTIDDGKVSLSSVDKRSKAEKTARETNASTADNPDPNPPFRVKPNNSGFVEGVEQIRLNRLLDDLDVEDFLAKQEGNIRPSPDAMSLEDAYGSVKPSSKPEDFEQITAIAKQAKAEQTARELNDAWTS